jgi:hypothetical protein
MGAAKWVYCTDGYKDNYNYINALKVAITKDQYIGATTPSPVIKETGDPSLPFSRSEETRSDPPIN